MLEAAKLDGIAAANPAAPDSFVAALYIPARSSWSCRAKYSAPALLVEKSTRATTAASTWTCIPRRSRAASLRPGPSGRRPLRGPDGDNGADMWDEGTKSTAFDGEWKKAKMSEADYTKVYTDADERYAKMLSLLLAQAKQKAKPGW